MVSLLDGFGPCGKRIADYFSNQLSYSLYNNKKKFELAVNARDIQKSLKASIKEAEDKLKYCDLETDVSGSTFLGVFLEKTRIHTINIGTGRAFLARNNPVKDSKEVIELSSEHRLGRADEKRRVIGTDIADIKKAEASDGAFFGPERIFVSS